MKRRTFLNIIPVVLAGVATECSKGVVKGSRIKFPARGISAHRGACDTCPENTLAAFREAINVGAHIIEIDVQFTKDRELVIIHDNTVNRTTNGDGKVSGYTLAEIKRLDAGNWKSSEFKGEQVPTLKETLNIMPENTWLLFDIKGGKELAERVLEMIGEENRLNQSIFLNSGPVLKSLRTINPNILINIAGPRGDMWKYVNMATELKADLANVTGTDTTEFLEQMKKLHKNGIRLQNSVVNSPEELRKLFAAGIDFSLTNELHMMMKIVEEFGIKPLKPKFRSK
jgi:glycerophosphoryl diester phosphodiesterase